MVDLHFEWDEAKRLLNVKKHGLDFVEAAEVFAGVHLIAASRFADEERLVALGRIRGKSVAVVFTRREDRIRIISIRRAHRNEQKAIEILESQSPQVDD